jgi:hypothetical protein
LIESNFLDVWKKSARTILRLYYPQMSKDELDKYLDNQINKNFKDFNACFVNNYTQNEFNTSGLSTLEWVKKTEPIISFHGTFFMNQKQSVNPAAYMLDKFLTLRKKYKKEMFKYKVKAQETNNNEDKTLAKIFDIKQANEKIGANAWYGASGLKSFIFYNLHSSLATTGSGQALISTAEMAFESFLANSVKFMNMDECLVFINNVIKSHNKDDEIDILTDEEKKNITDEVVLSKLQSTFKDKDKCSYNILTRVLSNLSKDIKIKLFYKNNLLNFFKLDYTSKLLHDLIIDINDFKDPNEPPKESINKLNEIWNLLKIYVFHNYPVFDRILRLKREERSRTITIDTDSNMICVDPWYKFIRNNICKDINKEKNTLRFIIVNVLAYFLGKMIADVLEKFCKHSNIPKEIRPRINMKNEFLNSRMILTPNKKNYASRIEMQEGKYFPKGILDIKGLAFIKSEVNAKTKEFFTNLMEKMLSEEEIDIIHVLHQLEWFENYIRQSLENGEDTFLKPISVKEFSAYKDAWSQQGVLAVNAWNVLFEDREISMYPAKVNLLYLKLDDLNQLEKLKSIDYENYKLVKEKIFENKEEKIASKGLGAIAIPKNQSIPEWLRPFIDIEKFIDYNIKPFIRVLNSLGLETIHISAGDAHYSNIIEL